MGDVGRNPLLEQAMNAGEELTKVLRLLCLASLVGGLPPAAYDGYRKLLLAVRRPFPNTQTAYKSDSFDGL